MWGVFKKQKKIINTDKEKEIILCTKCEGEGVIHQSELVDGFMKIKNISQRKKVSLLHINSEQTILSPNILHFEPGEIKEISDRCYCESFIFRLSIDHKTLKIVEMPVTIDNRFEILDL